MFRIRAEAQDLERAGRVIVHLEIGDTSAFTNPELRRLLQEEAPVMTSLGYSPSAGEPALRDALAREYARECGVDFGGENVVVTPANAAVSQLLNVLCDEGDHVLLPDPGFSTYQLAAHLNGLEPVFFSLREETQFRLDLEMIRSCLANDRRIGALIIDNPSNPLGLHHGFETMDGLATMCAEIGIPFIVDETYRNLVHAGRFARVPHHATSFYVYSLSKDAAAPALRIGCVVGDPAVIAKIADYNSLFYSCLPKPLQLAAAAYIDGGHLQANVLQQAIAQRIETASAILRRSSWISFVKPTAAIYLYINVSRTGLTGDAFASRLLAEMGVCVCPGTGFGPSGTDYVRVCLSGNEAELYPACEAFVRFTDSLAARMLTSV